MLLRLFLISWEEKKILRREETGAAGVS